MTLLQPTDKKQFYKNVSINALTFDIFLLLNIHMFHGFTIFSEFRSTTLAKDTKLNTMKWNWYMQNSRDMKAKNICYVSDSDTIYDKYERQDDWR